MQAFYAARFEREMGCTEAEWIGWLPRACAPHPVAVQAGRALVTIGDGRAAIGWRTLPPRRIALITLPRLAVAFAFEHVDDAARQRFMRHFDLATQRGGG